MTARILCYDTGVACGWCTEVASEGLAAVLTDIAAQIDTLSIGCSGDESWDAGYDRALTDMLTILRTGGIP